MIQTAVGRVLVSIARTKSLAVAKDGRFPLRLSLRVLLILRILNLRSRQGIPLEIMLLAPLASPRIGLRRNRYPAEVAAPGE